MHALIVAATVVFSSCSYAQKNFCCLSLLTLLMTWKVYQGLSCALKVYHALFGQPLNCFIKKCYTFMQKEANSPSVPGVGCVHGSSLCLK